jgi:hypothetical protein
MNRRMPREDDLVHLPGDFLCGFSTMCGYVDVGVPVETSETCNCRGCIAALRTADEVIRSRRGLPRSWRSLDLKTLPSG